MDLKGSADWPELSCPLILGKVHTTTVTHPLAFVNILPTCLKCRLLGRRGPEWSAGSGGREEGEGWGLFAKQPDASTLWYHTSCAAPQPPTQKKTAWETSGLDSYLFCRLEGLRFGHIFFLPFLSLSFFNCEMG